MGVPHPPEQSLLFVGVLYSDDNVYCDALSIMQNSFGNVLKESHVYEWSHSKYYCSELGEPVFRRFIFFDGLFDASRLPLVKLESNEMEKRFLKAGRRQINLDPGYITSSKVVLASAKDYSHRLYIGNGIYAEVALFYQGNKYNPMPYTYQDYREQERVQLFEMARMELKKLMKTL